MLGWADALPYRPQRILVAGTSGSGKTTLAAALAELWEVPHIEIDGLHHGPDWTRCPTFEAGVRAFAATTAWVTEWQYSSVRPLLAERADAVVWLDLRRHVVIRRVVGRTLRRRWRRTELWNGNVEPPLRTFFTDGEHIVRWAWSSHGRTAARLTGVAVSRPDLPIVRLRSPRDVRRWLGRQHGRSGGGRAGLGPPTIRLWAHD